MTQLEQMQQVISNYVKNFRPESYRFFTTYGISPEHLNPSSCKELPEEQVYNMRRAFDSITQQTKKNGSMFYQQKTAETNDWMYFGFAQDEYTRMKSSDLNCRIYLPIAEGASHDYFMAECLKILINSEIKFTGKVAKTYRNDSLMFEFEEKEHAKKFVELFMQREDLRGMLGLHNPFLRDVQGLGFVDFENFNPNEQSYTSLVAHELEDYVFGLQAEDMQHGKENASVEGFKKFLEQEKTNPHKNSAMLDQIIGEIEHCETLHLQSINNAAHSNRESGSRENTPNTTTPTNTIPKKESRNLEPKTIGDSFNELKILFETYELVEADNGIGLIDRKTGEYVKKENNLQQYVEKVTFAKKWIEAAGVDLSLSGGMNEFGIDPKQYEMAFNDGARATFESMFGGLAQMGQSGQNFDLSKLQQFVQNGTGYKYSSSLVKGLLSNPQGEEVYLPQNEGVPTKKPWEYSVIKREIENIALANQMAKTADLENSQSVGEREPLQTVEEVSENATTSITSEQLKIRMGQKEKLDEIADLRGTLEELSYINAMDKIGQCSQDEWDAIVSKWSNTFETRRRDKEDSEAWAEREKNKPNEAERKRIYDLVLNVGLLENRMRNLANKGLLAEIPEEYVSAINNTINNLRHLCDKKIVGESGQEKSVTEILGKLWDMNAEDAIACVESEVASGRIQDADIISILHDFVMTKRLIGFASYKSDSYSHMPPDAEYYAVLEDWRNRFVADSKNCYTIDDVYKRMEKTIGLHENADYFFGKNKARKYQLEYFSDKNQENMFIENLRKNVQKLEMTEDLAM